LVTLALPGSVYLYQGEELGLPEVLDLPDEARQDPIFARSGRTDFGRDGCRVPLPWQHDGTGSGLGFSMVEHASSPWLPQPGWFASYALDSERTDPDSMYNLYRRGLGVRRTLWSGPDEPVHWLQVPGRPDVLAFTRGRATCVAVCGDRPLELPADWGEVVLASQRPAGRLLPGDGAAWVIRDAATGD